VGWRSSYSYAAPPTRTPLLLLVRPYSYSPSNHNPDVPLPTQALLPTNTKPDDVVPLLLLPALLVQAPRIRLLVCLASEGLATQCYSLKTQSLNHTRNRVCMLCIKPTASRNERLRQSCIMGAMHGLRGGGSAQGSGMCWRGGRG
jgi:hypothetical protein